MNISDLNHSCLFLKILMIFLMACNSLIGQDQEIVTIPEPLMFDLVKGLGAKRGELEINSLADFPLNDGANRGIDWAPEIEYVLFDNFAIELEFPLNDLELEAYKMALQWTIGTSENNQFIHGIQVIGEKFIHDDILELHFLYVPAYRFNDVWSAIGLFGVMLESGVDVASRNYSIILNASLFADLNKHTVVGLEINNSDPTFQLIDDNSMELLILPQAHYEFENGLSFQLGTGPQFSENRVDASLVLRAIKTF